MDCRTCQPVLLDLLYGELSPDSTAQARQHLNVCDTCRGALDALEGGLRLAEHLPQAPAPASASAAIAAMAEQHAANTRERKAKANATQPGLWRRLIDFIGRFAMAPQVAMATIMVLIVALGAWWVPQLSQAPELAGNAVVQPEPEGPSGEVRGVEPAEPLELQVDQWGRRIRAKGDEPVDSPAAEDAPGAQTAEAKSAKRTGEQSTGADAKRGGDLNGELFAQRPRPVPKKGAGSAGRANSGGPSAFPENEKRRREPASRPAPAFSAEAAAADQGASERAARAEDKADSARALYDRALSLYEAGRYGAAAAVLQELTARADATPLRDDADLLHARVLRRWRGCAAALQPLQRLSQAASSSRGSALLELAACHEQLGDRARARAALEQAAKLRSSAARAQRRLRALDTAAESASEPARSPSAASAPTSD